MIKLRNSEQITEMKQACRITGETLLMIREHIREGVSTYELDKLIRTFIEKCGAKPSFLGYAGFPGSACISINDEVIHGIPSKKKILQEGDIVKVDVGAFYKGYHGDAARTIPVGHVSAEAEKLILVTRNSFFEGVKNLKIGNRLGDVGAAVDALARANGFTTVKRYVGHGVGSDLHESPDVPNYGTPGRGIRLMPGMTLAIEPMLNAGVEDVYELPDGWTVKTRDRKLSAHYENSVALTNDGVIIMTQIDEDY